MTLPERKGCYSKNDPFFASLKDRFNLCSKESQKKTYHLSLDLENSGLVYTVGDCIGICPENDVNLVEKILKCLKIPGSEWVFEKKTQERHTLFDFLKSKANLAQVNKKLWMKLGECALEVKIRECFQEVLAKSPEDLRAYLEERDVLKSVQEAGALKIEPQEFVDLLMPLLPRFYSIASSMKKYPHEVHLTVAKVNHDSFGKTIYGVCTHFLSKMPLKKPIIPIFLQPHSGFTLPEDASKPIIMIGPGTGVAPFRAFMQEREALSAPGKNWLFYGDWFKESTFLYKEYWKGLEKTGRLKMDLAFSRDQEEKVYVQHRMLEKGKEFYSWLEEGAFLYVCGDAKKMAKDVEGALIALIAKEGSKTEDEAKEYVRSLRKQGRYLRDVY